MSRDTENNCVLGCLVSLFPFFLHGNGGYIFGSGMRCGPKLMFSDKGNRSGNNHAIDITNAIDIITALVMKSSKLERICSVEGMT